MLGSKRISAGLSWVVLLIASLVLLGWLTGNEHLTSVVPGLRTMNPLTACLFILSGSALLALQKKAQYNSLILSVIVIALAGIRFAGYHSDLNIPVDRILFSDSLDGSRMAPNTTLAFLLCGFALLSVSFKRKLVSLAQLLILASLVISMLALIGYLYALAVLYMLPSYLPMPIHTAFAFMLFSLAFLFKYSGSGFMAVIFDWKSGGSLARKFLPAAILVPVLLGWILISNKKYDIFNAESGIAILVIGIILVFSVMIWLQARLLNRSDAERRKAEWELIRARKIAEDAKRIQEQFMTNMSHEIRTPMNGVIGITNLLARTALDDQQKEFVQTVKESSANLLVVLNDILDFNKISSGQFHFQHHNFRLSEVVSNVLKLQSFKAADKGLALSCEFDSRLEDVYNGDPARLNQILLNLIGNAIKFTEKGSVKVKVSLAAQEGSEQRIKFSVSDTGIGISDDALKLIFNSYTQASANSSRRYGGTGLGLSITKQLVELQNGRIWVESSLGNGSTFSAEIPFLEADPSLLQVMSESQKISETALFRNSRILLVEDNKINQKVALFTLAKWGAEIDLAENGAEALELLHRNQYDLVLLDLQMPVMDGFETALNIRQLPGKTRNIPIIAMTASALITEREKCLAAGMNDYLSKPFVVSDLREKIKAVLPEKPLRPVEILSSTRNLGVDPAFA